MLDSCKDICSDHVSVEAEVSKPGSDDPPLRCATWNVADPFSFSQFPGSSLGFSYSSEDARLRQVRDQVLVLLGRCDVVALQEVPSNLVSQLDADAAHAGFGLRKWKMNRSDRDGSEGSSTRPCLMLLVRSEMANEALNVSEPHEGPTDLAVADEEPPDSWEDLC